VYVGYDVESRNKYIKNKHFGKGNSILVFDGTIYYSISDDKIRTFKKQHIKGDIVGYISPIGPSDVPYPMLFTKTHLYSWCDNIDVFPIPTTKKEKKIMKLLCKARHPFDIPNKEEGDVKDFSEKYMCYAGDTTIKQKTIYSSD
tara:strand:- start:18 stop:449 length:432 start_codon:yes stop_codon:yes gene_type:complete